LTFKTPTKINLQKKFFCLLLFEGTCTSFFKESSKEVAKQYEPRFFLLFLLDDKMSLNAPLKDLAVPESKRSTMEIM
jgi:hypothetical protein